MQILVDLFDLEGDFRAPAPRLRGLSDELPSFAFKPGGIALDGCVLGHRIEILFPEALRSFQFVEHEADLPRLGLALDDQTADLLLKLRNALAQLRLEARPRGSAAREQAVLGGKRLREFGIAHTGCKRRRQVEVIATVALGLEPQLPDLEFVQLLEHKHEVRTRHGFVQTKHDIALTNGRPVLHEDLTDHAAGWVLHALRRTIDDDIAAGHDGSGDLVGGREPAQAKNREGANQQPQLQASADDFVGFVVVRRLVHGHWPAPLLCVCGATTLSAGPPARWVIRASTSSFSPKA